SQQIHAANAYNRLRNCCAYGWRIVLKRCRLHTQASCLSLPEAAALKRERAEFLVPNNWQHWCRRQAHSQTKRLMHPSPSPVEDGFQKGNAMNFMIRIAACALGLSLGGWFGHAA